MQEELYALDLLIRNNTNDKELKFLPRKTKSELPLYKIDLR